MPRSARSLVAPSLIAPSLIAIALIAAACGGGETSATPSSGPETTAGGIQGGALGSVRGPVAAAPSQSTKAGSTTGSSTAAGGPGNSTETSAGAAPTRSSATTAPKGLRASAGRHCYALDLSRSSTSIDLDVAADGTVSGERIGYVHDELNAAFYSFTTTLTGSQVEAKPSDVKVVGETLVDGDTQELDETWVIVDDAVDDGRLIYGRINCADVPSVDEMAGGGFLPLSSNTSAESVRFVRGMVGTVLTGALPAGATKEFTIGSSVGQDMRLRLSSDTGDAVMTVLTPSGTTLSEGTDIFDGRLAQSGPYVVRISGAGPALRFDLNVRVI